ncbi:MAG: DUF3450 family protein [Puniceicoccaceae bacterium]|nr:MAG: DUF3450 family protein [Puniceicoccaceae bacterium]
MKTLCRKIFVCVGAALPFALPAQTNISETRDVLDKWVETRQIISKERASWRTEKSILGDTVVLLTNQVERLEQSITEMESTATAADEDRTQLTQEQATLLEATAVIEQSIAALETQLKGILPFFPEPLLERIRPLIRRLPDDPGQTNLAIGERLQNVVGILSQTDRFNTTLTQTSESREIEPGKTVEVRTLYWGLAMAYYVDASGQYAGIGMPGPDGWEWPQIEGIGPDIRRLLDVYEGTGDIQFVELPARIR